MKVNRHGKANGGVFRDNPATHLNPRSASRVLKKAFDRVEIDGASTHSMRRTALTLMSNAGIPLRTIQEVSGHRNLEQLQQYLEVQPEQVRGAVSILSMLSPIDDTPVNIPVNVHNLTLEPLPSNDNSPSVDF
ncbi:tyrosine-type recombinase/integrase [Planktothrix agardhii]|uniref:tyrosine-type recombinase/integrase n=1 Tax=Planktothrix agardhii TaxID=1160 RepID=UPI002E2FBB02|nr:tyrosine-type recombinase/integrase [Planktothrix agardhii]